MSFQPLRGDPVTDEVHEEILDDLQRLDKRLDALEHAAAEQEGAVKFGKWMIALLIAAGSVGLAAYKIFSGD